MKKLVSILGVVLFFGALTITSCSSKATLCPAYPPSTYHGEVIKQNTEKNNIENIELQSEETL